MAFIRVKRVKGLDYYYLVKSQWDAKRKISTQHTIKYLGKVSDVKIENIPSEYQNDPKILSLISSVTNSKERNTELTNELRQKVLDSLKTGKIEHLTKVAEEFKERENLSSFYEDILKPVMYEIGSLWQNNQIDIGIEHVCSNMANRTIHILTESIKQRTNSESILMCTPDGELHNIACNMIESVLLEKGFKTSNISPSIPTDSVIAYMRETNPSIVLLSVTLHDNIGSALRLITKMNLHFQTPILLGGQAINNCSEKERREIELSYTNVTVIANSTLESLIRVIRSIIKNSRTTSSRNYEQDVIAL